MAGAAFLGALIGYVALVEQPSDPEFVHAIETGLPEYPVFHFSNIDRATAEAAVRYFARNGFPPIAERLPKEVILGAAIEQRKWVAERRAGVPPELIRERVFQFPREAQPGAGDLSGAR